VHAVIAGRLARLSPGARRVVELAATIGRAFSLEVLVEAGTDDEASTVLALDELWQKRLVREQSTGVFDFTHDKLREVAYAGLSAPQRRFLHRHVAQALAALHAADLDPVSAQIAAHYEQAGLFAQAIPYYQRAGSVAAQVYANDDAIRSLTHARSLLSHLPAGTQRDTQELSLLLALSPLYNVTLGWASPELERILDRAVSLAITAGDAAQQAQALYCLQSVHTVQARLAKVQATHATIQALFLQTQGTVPPFANLMVAAGLFHMGQLSEAEAGLRAIVAVREERYLRSLQASQGVNYLVMGHSYHAHVLWCLGYPKAALTSAAAASDYAREYEQPFSRALAITYMALLQEWCAGPDTFLAYARDAHTLTGDCQAPYYHAWAHILVAFGEAWQRPEAAQVAGLRAAIDQFTETGAHLRLPVYYSLLARAYQRAGLTEPALAALQQALAEAEHTQEHWWDAELHRLRGELLLAQGATPAAAEGAFQQASTIAQAQQARCLELRAALSLARLWQRQGRAQAGRQLLEPLYAWFREGLETPDLAAAREFLAIP
jgi:predicted negative regulator of RcsB-dependent stress response